MGLHNNWTVGATKQWVRTCEVPKEAEPSLSDKVGNVPQDNAAIHRITVT